MSCNFCPHLVNFRDYFSTVPAATWVSHGFQSSFTAFQEYGNICMSKAWPHVHFKKNQRLHITYMIEKPPRISLNGEPIASIHGVERYVVQQPMEACGLLLITAANTMSLSLRSVCNIQLTSFPMIIHNIVQQ